MENIVQIISVKKITHNVKRFRVTKPDGYHFNAGQATEVSVNEESWKDKKRPFTFTALNSERFLEFTIKIYEDHQGVTQHLDTLKKGDELIISDVWGAIEYKGPGYFIAGGAGITPLLAILRQLHQFGQLEGNKLFFSNQTAQDIILKDELQDLLCQNVIFTTTRENNTAYDHRRIDAAFLKTEIKDFNKHFYVCGPDQMVSEINKVLVNFGISADSLVFEQ
jgi:ferredoxin-NADP reductase